MNTKSHFEYCVSRLLLLVVLVSGCSGQVEQSDQKKTAVEKTWHEKFDWNAEEYFTDPQVVELCHAIEANDLKRMQELIDDGVDVNTLGKGNMTPLLWSFPDNKLERFELLLKSGADPNVYFESNFGVVQGIEKGETVTHMACRSWYSHFDYVFQYGGDPNLVSKGRMIGVKETPLFAVLRGGHYLEERMTRLLDLGVDINQREAVEMGGYTAVMAAASRGRYDLCLFMLEKGADPRAL